MAKSVKIRSKSYLPGAGKDANGNPSARKQRVVGQVDVSSYNRGGESLTATDLGLDALDWLDLKVKQAVTGNNPGQGTRQAYYADDNGEFYVTRSRIAGGESEVAAGSVLVIRFVAEGDAASVPELR